MILTVTLNTALDITYRVPALTPARQPPGQRGTRTPGRQGPQRRPRAGRARPRERGHRLRGRRHRAVLRELLAAARRRATRSSRSPGPPAARSPSSTTRPATPPSSTSRAPRHPREWAAFLDRTTPCCAGADAVALCGSLPPGIHVGAYAELIRTARAAGVPVLLDTSGEPLRRGIAARPDLVKPNADELAAAHRLPRTAARHPRRPPPRRAHRRRLARPRRPARRHPGRRLAGRPRRRRCRATRRARATRRWPGCCPAWSNGCRGRTGWPARWPCRRRPYWPRRRASSTRAAYEELLPRIAVTERAAAA